jgi:hypothetical protein
MPHLHQVLAARVDAWRSAGYPCDAYPGIAEMLEYARATDDGHPRFLRKPQLRALETYWYLRLVENTPKMLDLYRRLFPKQSDRMDALGLGHGDLKSEVLDNGLDVLLDRVRTDDELVRRFRLEALRETLTLDYPSYILALAMGAGKTVLIGSIYATEFALAMEHPGGPFVQNALVFAPASPSSNRCASWCRCRMVKSCRRGCTGRSPPRSRSRLPAPARRTCRSRAARSSTSS